MASETITRTEWDRTHPDFRTGTPADGTAHVLRHNERTGGCELVPVQVAGR